MKITRTASGKKTLKMSKSEWTSIGKKAGWMKSANYKVVDCPFNKANYKDLIGKVFAVAPSYCQVLEVQDPADFNSTEDMKTKKIQASSHTEEKIYTCPACGEKGPLVWPCRSEGEKEYEARMEKLRKQREIGKKSK